MSILPPGESLDVDGLVGLYACAVTTMEAFLDGVARDEVPSIVAIRRIAQRFVSASASGSRLLRAVTSLTTSQRTLAARAIQSAALSVLVAREATDDRATLSRIAEAAMLVDAGSVALAGDRGGELPELLQAQVPAKTVMTCLEASGGTSDAAQVRGTLAFEAAWLERESILGPLKASAVGPLLGARLIVTVRSLLERIAPAGGAPGVSPPDAMRELAQAPGSDPLLVRLMVSALGALPVGTVVELSTGEWAVVAAPPSDLTRIDQPRVRVVTDPDGRAREQPVELDLAAEPRSLLPSIARIVPPERARFNVAAALFG